MAWLSLEEGILEEFGECHTGGDGHKVTEYFGGGYSFHGATANRFAVQQPSAPRARRKKPEWLLSRIARPNACPQCAAPLPPGSRRFYCSPICCQRRNYVLMTMAAEASPLRSEIARRTVEWQAAARARG